jgi:outer membrane protein OmpA-like peptidoglycan-associated protein
MQSSSRPDEDSAGDAEDLLRLRQLLLGADYDELLALKQDLNDPEAFSMRLASVITEALSLRSQRDHSLAEVLAPTLESAIKESIASDPEALAESLYPGIGPAIRKSISETLSQMLENMNQLLEQSLSPKSLGWRFNAWRTGRSYAEIVLINTLEYQVEQVFLIHRETSLLIQHLVADMAISKDPDMVSGMLSAIQDYILDSFTVGEGDGLNSMSLGDFQVMIEAGPRALIAAVVRGKPPENLRNTFKVALEDVHKRASSRLQDYSGDPDDYQDLESTLRSCLRVQRRDQAESNDVPRSIPWLALVSIALLSGVGIWFWFQSYTLDNARQNALTRLVNEPGIVVVSSRVVDDLFLINGLRDRLAEAPEQVLSEPGIGALGLTFVFEPYLSTEPMIVERRAIRRLAPPVSARMSVQDGTLVVTGAANVSWIGTLEQHWRSVAGLDALNVDDLDRLDPVRAEMESLATLIEATTFYFDRSAAEPNSGAASVPALALAIKRLAELGETLGITPVVRVLGAADGTGAARFNARLAEQRAENLYVALLAQGIPAKLLVFQSLQDFPGLDAELSERKVMFRLTGLSD